MEAYLGALRRVALFHGMGDRELLSMLDVLVDGPFLLEQKDIRLRFRGSANQRILDVPRSLAAGEPSGGTAPRTESSGSPELSGCRRLRRRVLGNGYQLLL